MKFGVSVLAQARLVGFKTSGDGTLFIYYIHFSSTSVITWKRYKTGTWKSDTGSHVFYRLSTLPENLEGHFSYLKLYRWYTVYSPYTLQWAAPFSTLPLQWVDLDPHLTRGSWAYPSPHPMQHLDRFNHFCTAYDRDRQTTLLCNNRPHLRTWYCDAD